jgi:elongation factor Ts
MQVNASMVKELRERTGAGMMECKKALEANGGDIEAAIESMRKAGLARADKRATRIAAEGVIWTSIARNGVRAAMVEINCETDFVAKGDDFAAFAQAVADSVLQHAPTDIDALMSLPIASDDAVSVEAKRQALISKLGENIQVRRFHHMAADGRKIGVYLHGSRIGVLVDLKGGDDALAKDIAMHVAASRPLCVSENDVPPELLEKERAIFTAQAESSGKPAEIIDKMVQGRLKKYLSEITLLGQPFVKDPDKSVGRLLKDSNASVRRFTRFEVGEGIEKKGGSFADEVMAQVKGSENDAL